MLDKGQWENEALGWEMVVGWVVLLLSKET